MQNPEIPCIFDVAPNKKKKAPDVSPLSLKRRLHKQNLKVSTSLQPTTPFNNSNKNKCFLLFLSWIIRFGASVNGLEWILKNLFPNLH